MTGRNWGHEPFRRLSSPLFLVAALIALSVFFATGAQPAQAQTTVWSATLTVDGVNGYFGCDNSVVAQDNCSDSSVLTSDDFSYEGATYTIRSLSWSSFFNRLYIRFDGLSDADAKTALTSLTLNVDGAAFAIFDSRAADISWRYNPATDWVDGQQVSVSLVDLPPGPALNEPVSVPEHMASARYWWQDTFQTLEMDFTIRNDPGNFSNDYGLYLMLGEGSISGTTFYFGIQTNVQRKGKGAIFSRWGTRDLSYARYSQSDGWAQSSGHEGDFIGVRRSYDWSTGDYRVRLAPDGKDSDGVWFGLWLTALSTGETTWVGSLKFPLIEGEAKARAMGYSTMEIYGWAGSSIRPTDIPFWHVSLEPPKADGAHPWRVVTEYSGLRGELRNSDVRYDEGAVTLHIRAGGDTKRTTAAAVFLMSPAPKPTSLTLTRPHKFSRRTLASWNPVDAGGRSLTYHVRWRKANQTPEAQWSNPQDTNQTSMWIWLQEEGRYQVQVASDNGIMPIAWSDITEIIIDYSAAGGL